MGEAGRREPFAVRDCAVTALATGEDAWTLRELSDRLSRVPPGSLYYHFQGRLLRPVFEVREFNNDLADWAAFSLRDPVLAERLALVDPAEFEGLEDLREELVDLMEERIAENGPSATPPADRPFRFIEGRIVIFDTDRRIDDPAELGSLCREISRGSVYYHFVDARHRNPDGRDDFQRWLDQFGPEVAGLQTRLSSVDVHFSTLDQLRGRLTDLCGALPAREQR